jgi:hypothetical protein
LFLSTDLARILFFSSDQAAQHVSSFDGLGGRIDSVTINLGAGTNSAFHLKAAHVRSWEQIGRAMVNARRGDF